MERSVVCCVKPSTAWIQSGQHLHTFHADTEYTYIGRWRVNFSNEQFDRKEEVGQKEVLAFCLHKPSASAEGSQGPAPVHRAECAMQCPPGTAARLGRRWRPAIDVGALEFWEESHMFDALHSGTMCNGAAAHLVPCVTLASEHQKAFSMCKPGLWLIVAV